MQREKIGSEPGDGPADCNEVRLVGRLAAGPEERVLPSGDVLLSWRLVVRRPAERRRDGRRTPSVDTVDCVTRQAGVVRALGRCAAGDVLELGGALRRRFWRGPGGPVSRYEVDVTSLRRAASQRRAG